MRPLDRVKALLATLPSEDLSELSHFIDGILDPPDLEDAEGVVASVRARGGAPEP